MKNKSFTLIELLVVISIIGLISSIVLVNFKGTREKARIAKVLEFSQSVYHALGADAVGIWRFDEGLGSTAYDSSGYGNNGVINGASYTTGILGSALSFDGTNDYVNAGTGASLNIRNNVSLEAWIKVSTVSGVLRLVGKSGGGWATSPYWLTIQNNWTYFYVADGNTYVGAAALGQVQADRWHHLVGTYDGATAKLYIDGKLVNSGQGAITLQNAPTNPFYIGGNPTFGGYATGYIDEVRVYNQALTAFEIQKHYTEGLEKHQNLAIK